MRKESGFWLGAVSLALMVAWGTGAAQGLLCDAAETPKGGEEKGKQIFLDNKCTKCHVISALGIGGAKKEEGEKSGDVVPPDLSDVGTRREAPWIMKYLQKGEKIEGRKHKLKFKGSEEELKTVSEWLASLKHKSPAGGGDKQ